MDSNKDIETQTEQQVQLQSAKSTSNETAPDEANSVSTYFVDTFSWMDPVLYYSPIWITKKSNKDKKLQNNFLLVLKVGFVLLYFGLQCFYQGTGWKLFSNLDNVIWCGYILGISLSRILAIVYCHKHFNWAWKQASLSEPFQHSEITESCKQIIARCNRLYISMALAYIVIDVSILILEADALMPYYHFSMATYVLVKGVNRIFLSYPGMISTIIESIILLKHLLCLQQIHENMMKHLKESNNVDLQDIFESYENLYKSYKRDYPQTLNTSIRFYLMAEILFFWDSVNFIGLFNAFVMVVLLMRIVPIAVLYVYNASILEIAHRKFSKDLWKSGRILLDNKDVEMGQNGSYYNYLLHYMQEYPIYLKVAGVIVSAPNMIKFSIGVFATRALAFAIQSWMAEKY